LFGSQGAEHFEQGCFSEAMFRAADESLGEVWSLTPQDLAAHLAVRGVRDDLDGVCALEVGDCVGDVLPCGAAGVVEHDRAGEAEAFARVALHEVGFWCGAADGSSAEDQGAGLSRGVEGADSGADAKAVHEVRALAAVAVAEHDDSV